MTYSEITSSRSDSSDALPLCVDLDETFCKVDTLWEVAMIALRHHPARLGGAIVGFLRHRSRSRFKAELSGLVPFDATHLPVRTEVRDYLRAARGQGRRTLLVTGADQAIADAVARAFPDFDEVHGSGNGVNLKSRNKATYLVKRFGEGGYEYVGDCGADVPVWRSAGIARVVAFGGRIPAGLRRQVPDLQALSVPERPPAWRVLRPHQWVKNLLLFVPLLAAHRLGEASLWTAAAWGALATSLAASAIYIGNDFLDVSEDRRHPEKRRRLIASGDIHFTTALGLAGGCVLGAVGIARHLPVEFAGLLVVYGGAALLYVIGLKRVAVVDVLVLTGLYGLRLLLGGAATGIVCSGWLLGFAAAFFGSLATLKRYAELRVWEDLGLTAMPGRAYSRASRGGIVWLGALCGGIALGMVPFYLKSEAARLLYTHPQWLFALIPLFGLGLAAIWRDALKGRLSGDPVTHALKTPINYWLALGAVVVLALAVG